ncbi:MAG TPA: hypothetical protein ENN09_04265, partial [Planctomycetes bacterium]|nr:hypothetical protein [Planctomycetota bacterium]
MAFRKVSGGSGRFACALALAALGSFHFHAAAGEEQDKAAVFDRAYVLMASRRYADAVKTLQAYNGARNDLAAYLQAYSLYKSGAAAAAEQLLVKLERQWPTSRYGAKSRMLRAAICLDRKDFAGAEALFRAQAEHLLSLERRRTIANMYLRIADFAMRLPAAADPAGTQPDYDKALRLFNFLTAMDLPQDLREYVYYRRVMAASAAQRFHEVANYAQAYMSLFDPFYRSDVLGEMPGQAERAQAGPNVARVRLAAVEASLRSSNALSRPGVREDFGGLPQPSTVVLLDNLIARLRTGAIADFQNGEGLKQALFLKPFAYGLKPTAGSMETGDGFGIARARRAVAAATEFMRAYPSDAKCLDLLRQVPRVLLAAGLTDDAIEAYRALVAGEGVDMADEPADADGLTPRERLLQLQAEAVFSSGRVFFDIGRFRDAAEIWRRYLTAYPNGAQWVDAQRSVYAALKALGAKALSEQRFDECRTEWGRVVAERPIDGETPWLAVAIAHTYAREADVLIEKAGGAQTPQATALYNKALDEFSKIAQRYPGHVKSYAHFYRAEIYRRKLNQLENAVREYRLANVPEARAALDELTSVELEVTSPRAFRSNEAAFVRLRLRNVPKLTVRTYNVNLADFFHKYHTTLNVRRLDLDLVSPDRVWEYAPPDYAEYRDYDVELPVEVDGPGAFAVRFEAEEYEATTLVLKSDIELVAACSSDEALVLVKDALKEAPVQGADVIFYAGDKKEHTLKLVTGKDGTAKGRWTERPTGEPYIFASFKNNVAVSGAVLSSIAATGLRPKGYIYTSRPVYLPGETVHVRGVIRAVKDGNYAIPEGGHYTIAVVSSDGKRIAEKTVELGRFGSFNAEFPLPEPCGLGRYSITVSRDSETYSGAFTVDLVQPSKVYVEISPSVPAALAGDTVDVKLKAAYYTGLPLVSRAVSLYLPDGRRMSLATDDKGEASYTVDTTPYYGVKEMAFRADVPGEDAFA